MLSLVRPRHQSLIVVTGLSLRLQRLKLVDSAAEVLNIVIVVVRKGLILAHERALFRCRIVCNHSQNLWLLQMFDQMGAISSTLVSLFHRRAIIRDIKGRLNANDQLG